MPSDQQPPSASPVAPPGVPLEYARPVPRERRPLPPSFNRRLIGAVRQAVFAAGIACISGGLGVTIRERTSAGPAAMAVGGVLVGLALPLRRGDRFW
jgi:hypothetical protein